MRRRDRCGRAARPVALLGAAVCLLAGATLRGQLPLEAPGTTPAGLRQTDGLPPREFALLTDPHQIAARVRQMSPAQRQALQRQKDRFRALGRDEQQRYRQLHRQLLADPQAEQLLQTARQYYDWLATLPAARRAELMDQMRDRRPQERAALVRAAREAQEKDWLRRNLAGLNPADAAALQRFLQRYVRTHEAELKRQLPSRAQEFWARLDPPRRERLLLVSVGMRIGSREFPPLTAADVAALEAALSPAAARQLHQARGEPAQRQLIQSWARALGQRADRLPPVPQDELERFYLRELTVEQRDRLNELTPEEMQRALRRLYLQDRLDLPPGRGSRRGDGWPAPPRPFG